MGCETIKLPGGITAIMCSRGRRPKPCCVPFCGRESVALCDYQVERNGKPATCDAPMCERHRHTIAQTDEDSVDWCEGHFNHEQRQAKDGVTP
jgi:hypothetical protein